MNQLACTLEKNFIEKRRNTCSTTCEFCSHLFLITLLVAGYGLSKTLKFPVSQYDVVEIIVPPPFINKAVKLSDTNIQSAFTISQLQPTLQTFLNGPLVVPAFDVYATVATFLTNTIGSSTSDLVTSVATGRRFGNLLNFGALHFAPYPSAAVDSYIQYMLNNTKTFKNIPYHLHSTESEGVKYILSHLEEHAFGFIIMREISPTTINYVIRQNYSTIPNTNTVVSTTTAGINILYQNYYLSGFLTLQDSVDQWAFTYTKTVSPAPKYQNKSSVTEAKDSVCRTFPAVVTMPFPTTAYDQNPFYPQVGQLLGLALTSKY